MATTQSPVRDFLDATTESGACLKTLCDAQPTLLVFLRHWGCSFCRETISDLARIHAQLEARGVCLVFVHMGTPERARPYFDYYNFSSIERISDPEQQLYRDPAFALRSKSIFLHIFDPAALKSAFGGIILRHGISLNHREDADQMPGVFVLYQSQIVRGYKYKSIADKPDFLKMTRDVSQPQE
jgi:peroxiredoxin